jgi:hypothetical protein
VEGGLRRLNPESITAVIRPRTAWEAVDLGLVLVRRDLWMILRSWCVTVLPLWALICVLLWNHPGWAIFVIWLLKPVYDRVPLFVISASLFGARPKVREVLKAWPKLMFSRIHVALITRRISMQRSFHLPVIQLERLQGDTLKNRLTILNREGGSQATSLTVAGGLLEGSVYLWVSMIVSMLIPEAGDGDLSFWERLGYGAFEDGGGILTNFELWVVNFTYMLALTLVEPFYVGGGFGLYVNSRTHLEGWDIELTFKKMSARLAALRNGVVAKAGLVLVGLFLCLGDSQALVMDAEAEVEYEYETPAEMIERIKADPDFTIHKKMVRLPEIDESREVSGVPFGFFEVVGQLLFWLVIVAVVGGLIYWIFKNLHLFNFSRGDKEFHKKEKERTSVVMGMNLEEKSLPGDITGEARRLWLAGDLDEAVRLLYRGSLSWFVNRAQLPVRESDTENECVLHAQQLEDLGKVTYFESLTDSWVGLAYGRLAPSNEGMELLLSGWPFSGKGGELL